jgi:hypothetical protein
MPKIMNTEETTPTKNIYGGLERFMSLWFILEIIGFAPIIFAL